MARSTRTSAREYRGKYILGRILVFEEGRIPYQDRQAACESGIDRRTCGSIYLSSPNHQLENPDEYHLLSRIST